MEFRKELKIVITQVHLIVFLVLGLHLAIPLALNNFQVPSINLYTSVVESSEADYQEVDLADTKEVQTAGTEGEAIAGNENAAEVIVPDIYVFRPYVGIEETFVKKNKIDELADMLSAPVQTASPRKINVRSAGSGASLANVAIVVKTVHPKAAESVSYEKILSKDDVIDIEKNKLKVMVQGLNPKFQKCYDDELFKDELLTGKLTIALKSNDVIVQFNGIGKNQSIENLKACVKRHCAAIRVPAFLQDNTIKFSFNLTGARSQ